MSNTKSDLGQQLAKDVSPSDASTRAVNRSQAERSLRTSIFAGWTEPRTTPAAPSLTRLNLGASDVFPIIKGLAHKPNFFYIFPKCNF